MTVLFHDVQAEEPSAMLAHRVPNANFDEVVYADDTICISTDTRTMNKRLARIEKHGQRYGLKLNYGKCELITNVTNANVRFADGTMVEKKQEARYLGCYVNQNSDLTREVNKRICECMSLMTKLNTFWLHSNCPVRFKLQAFNAVIQAKLLYGLESAVVPESTQRKLDSFQLKGLRKILNLKTTFVERSNTNQRVYESANSAAGLAEGKKIASFSSAYKLARAKLGRKVFTRSASDPLRYATIAGHDGGEAFHNFPNKRIGCPKEKWSHAVAKDLLADNNTERPARNFDKKLNTGHNNHLLQELLAELRNV